MASAVMDIKIDYERLVKEAERFISTRHPLLWEAMQSDKVAQIMTTVSDVDPPPRDDARTILERKVPIVLAEDWVKLVDAQIKEYVDADSSYDANNSYDTAIRHEAVMKTVREMGINEGDFGRWVEAARKKPRPQP